MSDQIQLGGLAQSGTSSITIPNTGPPSNITIVGINNAPNMFNNKPVLAIVDTLSKLLAKTMAFGGVETGSMNA